MNDDFDDMSYQDFLDLVNGVKTTEYDSGEDPEFIEYEILVNQ